MNHKWNYQPITSEQAEISQTLVQTFHCYVHVLHQEWIMQVGQLRTEEFPGIMYPCDSPLHQEPSQDRANA